MKTLIVTTVIGTVNAFLIPHIELLMNQGHKVDVAANASNCINTDLIKLGCEIHHINFSRSPFCKNNYRAYKQIKRLILEKGYELIHVHTPIASFLTRLACRKIPNLKVIYTVHGFHFLKGAPLKNWLIYYPVERLSARWTDSLITMNEEDYKIAQKFKIRKGGFINKVNGVGINLEKFQPQTKENKYSMRYKYGYKIEDFILFYAAELNYNKHQDLLINVVSTLKNRIPNIKLLLAGSGPSLGQYKNMVKQLDLVDNVEFLGFRNDIPNLLMLSDIVVASSRREGLPVNVMEAMATGLPVVATDVRGHSDLVKDGENGYLVRLDDIKGFAKAIENLYKDEKLRNKFGKNGIEMVKKYSLNNVLKEMNQIYSLLLK